MITISSCLNKKGNDYGLIQTIWTHHNSIGKDNDTLYLHIKKALGKTDYIYYENKTDSIITMFYSILKNEHLVFFGEDTLRLFEKSNMDLTNSPIRLFKYEYPEPTPGGMGCMVFTRQKGLLGTGLYVGGKKILNSWNGIEIDKAEVLEYMKWSRSEVPPPPANIDEKITHPNKLE